MRSKDTQGSLVPLQLLHDQRKSRDSSYAIGYPRDHDWYCIAIRECHKWYDECVIWNGYTIVEFWDLIDEGGSIEELMEKHFELFL